MPHYQLFGGCFESDLSFPELIPHSADAADWALRTAPLPPLADPEPVGAAHIHAETYVRLFRGADRYRIVYDDTGSFEVLPEESLIIWDPKGGADREAARLDVMGMVFPALFHAAGMYCLHASAVEVGAGGVAFIAPKFHGKSTLARALTRAGGRLATDDTLPIALGEPPTMRPGVHQVRLWEDSADHFKEDAAAYRSGYGGKHVLTDIEDSQLMRDPIPLDAVYLLTPFRASPDRPAARRVQIPAIQATLAIVQQAKIACLLAGAEAGTTFEMAAELAAAVPVYRLEVVRGYELLEEVVEQLLDWHGGAAPASRIAGAA